jgi:hydroxymethylglutaryl-CoA lyase
LGAFVPTAAKTALINALAGTGLRSFDAVSFVSPRAVPQMADGAEVIEGVERLDGMVLFGLVPNLKGLEAAVAAGVDGVGVLTAASDAFTERNINATVDESMHRIRSILMEVPEHLVVRGYVSTATHCPFEGEQDPDWVAHLAETLMEWGVHSVFLGETLGKATPMHVHSLLDEVLDRVPAEMVGVHFHDTYGQAIANTVASLERGITMMDASAGGLGGCPFAPGASGNVATEDVLWLLDGLGVEHGIDAQGVADVAKQFCDENDLVYNSAAGRAMLAARSMT